MANPTNTNHQQTTLWLRVQVDRVTPPPPLQPSQLLSCAADIKMRGTAALAAGRPRVAWERYTQGCRLLLSAAGPGVDSPAPALQVRVSPGLG